MGSTARTQTISRHKSRLQNKRAEKIVSMIDGYDSVHTLSRALATMLFLFIPLGVVMVLSGLMAAATSRDSTTEKLFAASFLALQLQSAVLWLVTLSWFVRVRSNVRRLGKSPTIHFWTLVKRQIMTIPLVLLLSFLAAVIPGLGPIFLVAAFAVLGYAQLFWPRVQYTCMDMLWRSGSMPTGQEDALPHFGPVWITALVVHQYTSVISLGFMDSAIGGLLLAVSGVTGIVAAFLGARLVVGVAERQDARLDVLIANSGADTGETASEERAMSTQELGDQWSQSAGLVDFPH